MTQVPVSLEDFARQLLLRHVNKGARPDDLVGAMEQGCDALRSRLTPLLGISGFDAIFRQAVRLTTNNFPFLATVDPPVGSDCAMDGLRQSGEAHEAKELEDAVIAILANFIWLLIVFIGENIALRKVHEVWPDVPLKSSGFSSQKAES
jgi:hypothetical protein